MSVPGERARTVALHYAPVLAKPAPPPVRILSACGAERIVAKADGTMTPIVDTSAAPPGADRRKFRKVHYPEAWRGPRPRQRRHPLRATLHDVTDLGLRRAQGVRAAGWGLNSRIHAVGDGAL